MLLPKLNELVGNSDEILAQLDVAAMNLACAAGLPGSENIDVAFCLQTLDRWANQVANYTSQHLHKIGDRSLNYFRSLCLVTVLERDLGMTYNPARREGGPYESPDLFIHGILEGEGGTCASLPVVVAAVGRRLGYPIRLVSAFSHTFARWESEDERFNIESHGIGMNCYPDDYYRHEKRQMTPEQERDCCCLQSKTPRHELAMFLTDRASIWTLAGAHCKATKCLGWAFTLHPENKWIGCHLNDSLHRWWLEIGKIRPDHTPKLEIGYPRGLMKGLPEEVEKTIIFYEVQEDLIKYPELQDVYRQSKDKLVDWAPRKIVVQYPASQLMAC